MTESGVGVDRRPGVALVAHAVHDHGGMERAFAELIRQAHEQYDFIVFTAELDEDLRALVQWRRIRVPMRPISLKVPLFSLLAGVKLARTRVDLVHTSGAIVPNRVDLATVHFCHAGYRELTGRFAPSEAPMLRKLNTTVARRIALAAERWSYRPARLRSIAAVSRGVAAEIRRHYPGLHVVLTPNGVDVERFRPDAAARQAVRNELGVGAEEIVVLFVGGEWDRKGLEVAIEGLAEAGRSTSRRLRLWVVGRGDKVRFGELAARCSVEDRVTFMGPQAAAERFYQAADVFVIPTLYETFSLAAHEAASAGLPVISTRVSGIEDLLSGEEAGLVVERTASGVGAAIARLADDDGLRERMGAAGRRRVSPVTWERSVENVTSAYDALLGRSRGADDRDRPLAARRVRA
jgi:UDP-glucose:(heptosyl)LPS alpha-1,3-glucosyltransferase